MTFETDRPFDKGFPSNLAS